MFIFSFTYAKPFQRARAALAAQKGDFKKANALLSSLIINSPNDSELLYDAGVSAFKLKQFGQAEAYFKNSAENAKSSDSLRQDAYFNCGNTSVELKNLEGAIKCYEKVLELNLDHQEAKHNLEIVKKMLQEQKQQEQDKENNQDKNKNDKNSDDQKSEQQQDDQRDQSESDKQDQQEQGQQDRKEDRNQQSDQNEKPETQNDRSDDSQSEKNEQAKKDQGQHGESPEKNKSQTDSQDKKDEEKEQPVSAKDSSDREQAAGPANQKPNQYDEQVMKVLEHMEKKEAEAQKKMMAAQVKQATGAYDKNQNNY